MEKFYRVRLLQKTNGGEYKPNPTFPYVGNGIDGKIWTTNNINEAHQEAASKSTWFNVIVEECL